MGETLRLTASDGHELDAYLARPEGTPRGGVVICQEIFGINQHIRDVTNGYANEGFLAIAPALFDRRRRGVELDYDEAGVAEGRALRGGVPWEQAKLDIHAAHKLVEEAGRVGVVGYCWGGTLAWLSACRLGPHAAVGYYGGQIHDYRDETPGCPMMLHFGELDAQIPAEHVDEIRGLHPEIAVFTYPAGHGFNCDARADFDEESASIAAERTFAFLRKHLE